MINSFSELFEITVKSRISAEEDKSVSFYLWFHLKDGSTARKRACFGKRDLYPCLYPSKADSFLTVQAEIDVSVIKICFGKSSYSVFTFLLVVGNLNMHSYDTGVVQMDACLSHCQKNLIL